MGTSEASVSGATGSARTPSPVLIVGAGLLGASVGLALRARGTDVIIHDVSPTAQALAIDYGAGRPARVGDAPVLVIVAVPPEITAGVVAAQLESWPEAVVTDVASVKQSVLDELRTLGVDLGRYLGSHPMAGRERSGPIAARADLFVGRPWVIAPHDHVLPRAIGLVESVALDVEAVPVQVAPADHDRAVAQVSHVPQIVSSLLAASLLRAESHDLSLAGQGLRDTTRIAASDPALWLQILSANAAAIVPVLTSIERDMHEVIEDLEHVRDPGALRSLADIFERGNRGVARIPGKHGSVERFASLVVAVDDRPGELARLLGEIGDIGVNMEDLRLEHSPRAPIGLAQIWVVPGARDGLSAELRRRGWNVTE